MIQFLRHQGLKLQMVFWMTLISILSFTVLFCINFGYYRSKLLNAQWAHLQDVSEVLAMTSMFPSADQLVHFGKADPRLNTLMGVKDSVIEKTETEDLVFFYKNGDELYQLVSEKDYMIPLEENPKFSQEVIEFCDKAIYTGLPETCEAYLNGLTYYYFIQPVMGDTDFKYGVCAYMSSVSSDLTLMRFVIVNVFSFFAVLIILDLLVIHAADKILIKPIIDMEKMVDSFVYQVSGGYVTLSFVSVHGNELMTLRKSLKRLEKLVKAHNRLMLESNRYSDWLKGNINQLDAERSTLEFKLKSTQYDMLCDKEVLVGNTIAWERKCDELDRRISLNSLEFLQLVCLRLYDIDNKRDFMEDLMKHLGIDKGIPMETVFRLDDDDFVFIFYKDGKLQEIMKFVKDTNVIVGSSLYITNKTKSVDDMLENCMMIINSQV